MKRGAAMAAAKKNVKTGKKVKESAEYLRALKAETLECLINNEVP
jgi:hypothetical protein